MYISLLVFRRDGCQKEKFLSTVFHISIEHDDSFYWVLHGNVSFFLGSDFEDNGGADGNNNDNISEDEDELDLSCHDDVTLSSSTKYMGHPKLQGARDRPPIIPRDSHQRTTSFCFLTKESAR